MNWFGPPLHVTAGSTWPWIDHSASGLLQRTRRAIHTRFRFGSALSLTSLVRVSRRLIMQKACLACAPTLCRHMISDTFHSPSGVLFHLSLAVLCAIGHQLVFRLGGWAPRIQSGFHVSRPTWDSHRLTTDFAYGGFTLYAGTFQFLLLSIGLATAESRNPAR